RQVQHLGSDARLRRFREFGSGQVATVHTCPKPAKVSAMHRPKPCPAPLTTTVITSTRICIATSCLCVAPERRARPDRVEQRPVAILQHMAFGIGRPRLQPERADDTVVAVVALQDDAGQRGHRSPAIRPELDCYCLSLRWTETSEWSPGDAREHVQRIGDNRRVATQGCHDIRLDGWVIRAGHIEFLACRNDHAGDNAEIVSLSRSESPLFGHRWPQSNRLARRCFIWSAMYSASAWIVEVGFTPPEVTNRLPSTMNRFFTSCDRPHSLTTERAGSSPMRAVPRRCQPPYRIGLLTQMSVASAAARISFARAMPCSIIRAVFSPIV